MATQDAFLRAIPQIADPIHTNGRYTLFRFRPLPASTIVERWTRTDLMRKKPVAHFRIVPASSGSDADAEENVTVSVSLNRMLITKLQVPRGGQEFSVRLPDAKPDPVNPFCVLFEADRPITVEDYRLLPVASVESFL